MSAIVLIIHHRPVPQPRPRYQIISEEFNGKRHQRVIAVTPAKHPIRLWKCQVVDAWRAVAEPGFMFTGPVEVTMLFVMPRPASKTRKTKPNPREWDTRAPSINTGDVDNIAKGVLDALNGNAWKDDCLVASLAVSKIMAAGGEDPHACVRIEDLDPLTNED